MRVARRIRVVSLCSASLLLACGGDDNGAATSDGGPSATQDGASPPLDGGIMGANDSGAGAHDGSRGVGNDAVAPTGSAPVIAGCKIFPDDNPWNHDVSGDPVDTAAMTNIWPNMHTSAGLHPDWGNTADQYGIPFTVSSGAPLVPMTWTTSWGPTESDPLACTTGGGEFCYPIPATALIEGGPSSPPTSDRHVLVLDTTGAPNDCTLYELYNGSYTAPGWTAQNGAIFHLGSNKLRPDGWTSSDAAGLPVLPGLVRWDEVNAGEIKHALRFTMNNTYNGYIHPATHAAGLSSMAQPPMGMRVRMKATTDLSAFTGPALVIATAMKKYGMILADNGSNWYLSGETNDGWTSVMDSVVAKVGGLHGSDFEVVVSGTVSTNGL